MFQKLIKLVARVLPVVRKTLYWVAYGAKALAAGARRTAEVVAGEGSDVGRRAAAMINKAALWIESFANWCGAISKTLDEILDSVLGVGVAVAEGESGVNPFVDPRIDV